MIDQLQLKNEIETLECIVNPPASSNFIRITNWRLAWQKCQGEFPSSSYHVVVRDPETKKPVWISPYETKEFLPL